ncbi:MAG TPA: PilZ domain-containing protein [Clostridiales bacterium]|nr:PilZ domain-containing protein [Clostridiales bacterium]
MSDIKVPFKYERRKFFRIKLPLPLEAILEVLEIKGRKVNVGNTKVLVKNIGPGGLCFVSDIKFPVRNEMILQFTFQLLEEEIKVRGNIVWSGKTKEDLYEYGVEFTIDENERVDLIRILNQVQIKIKKNILFSEGSFVSISYNTYFN